MLRKSVSRQHFLILYHQSVSRHFCNDTRRCDGYALRIPLYDRHLWNCHLRYCHGIIQQNIRLHPQFGHGRPHGLVSCLKDIDLINPGRTRHPHTHGDCFLHDLIIELFTFCSGQFLGIIEIKDLAVRRKDDRSRNHRACQRASSRLVNTADEPVLFILFLVLSHLSKAFPLLL